MGLDNPRLVSIIDNAVQGLCSSTHVGQSSQSAVIDNKSRTDAAKPVIWSLVRDAPPTDEVASAGCPELLVTDLKLLAEASLADDVMVGVTALVDVTTPPTGGGAEGSVEVVPVEADSINGVEVDVFSDAMPGKSSLENGSERRSQLTAWLRGECGRFKGEDTSTAVGTCLGVLGIATDDIADKRSGIRAPWLCSLRKT